MNCRYLWRCIGFFIINLLLVSSAFAVEIITNNHPIIVGVIPATPFANKVGDAYEGIAIDLWENIATFNHIPFQYQLLGDDTDTELNRLSSGKIDMVIGPISISAPRMEKYDFGQPFFLNSTGIIVEKAHVDLYKLFRDFLGQAITSLLICFVLVFILYIHLLWYFERGKLPDIPLNYREAMSKAIWIHVFSKGFSMPTTIYGRIVALIWILLTAVVFASLNASITSALTIALYKPHESIDNISELRHTRVAGIKGWMATNIAEKEGIAITKTNSLADAIELLEAGKVKAVVADYIIAKQYLQDNNLKNLAMSPLMLDNDEYAFVFPPNSPLRKVVNIGITRMQDSRDIITLCHKYLEQDSNRCDL